MQWDLWPPRVGERHSNLGTVIIICIGFAEFTWKPHRKSQALIIHLNGIRGPFLRLPFPKDMAIIRHLGKCIHLDKVVG